MLFLSMGLFGNKIIGITLLAILVVRLIVVRNPRLILMSIAAAGSFMVAATIVNASLKATFPERLTNQQLKVYPDMLKTNGASFSYVGQLQNKPHHLVFYGRFKSQYQMRQVVNSKRPVLLTVSGKISDFTPATNVNQFDMQSYYHHQKVVKVFTIDDNYAIKYPQKLTMVDRIHQLRSEFNHYCATLPKTLRIYAMGLISGSRQSDFFDEMTGVKRLGLLHVFSISGMHVYYFLAIVGQLLGWLRLPKYYKAVIELACIAGYFVFSGGSPGLFRAVVMAVIAIVNSLFRIGLSRLDVWSLCLMINLILLPEAMFLMGVQLSYGLSLGLIVSDKFSYVKQTVFTNLLTIPILLFHVYEWHLLSVAINLIVLPLFGKVIFPLVITGVLVGVMMPVLVQPIDWVLRLFNDSLNWVSGLPGMVTYGKPSLIVVILALLLTFGFVIKKAHPKGLMISLCLLYVSTFLVIHFPTQGEVSMFDIGQGDSFLIRTPFNKTVTLIDTGGKVDFSNHAWERGTPNYQAKRLSINYLKSMGISRIDYLCVSHQDADHCGDLPAFIKEMKIKNILIPLGMDHNPNFMKRIAGRNPATKVIPVNDEMRVPDLPLSIFHPYEMGKGENHDSMVLSGRFGGLNWLFTGDLDRPGEIDTLQRHPQLSTDVLKVGHHGSKTASDPQFISQVRPKFAWISAGRNNRYHHPNIETIETLQQAHIKIYNTQTQGMVRYVYRNNAGHFETVLHEHEGNA
ncbi:DNA internalization competence protein ComEC/Rec2-like protein [Lentilactobacillus kisonensis F0435]|uniref:DNA internalization competence protein ComEC/Rec2-like protein n=2 Tax=Lentilactobacillus kisonensis TaxID=481722 RepID=H1LCN6_9LACO|nr:DNA internalization competence protein ComEC/Rec2-like protein [Lentilactobacillus kisonensis F0435]